MNSEYKERSTEGQILGIIALILGILALIISFIPCIGVLALIPGGVAIILSLIAYSQANKANASKGIIIAALIISFIGTAIAGAWGTIMNEFADWDKLDSRIENIGNQLDDLENTMEELEDSTATDSDTNTLDSLENEMDKLDNNATPEGGGKEKNKQ
ncbi:MAG TPA: hypothetical protein DCQ31_17030 [Bacteroidales bacterium]|nr:hypothetical protein [Bacteroidales bacterium]